MILTGDSTNMQSLQNLPLWMVEGLAEYLSKGRVDPFTSMWMRDALMNDNFPKLRQLHRPEYFPYRYGQAFWAMIDGTFGTAAIPRLFIYTAKYGIEVACDSVLNTSFASLDNYWQTSMAEHYAPFLGDKKENYLGKNIINKKNGGRMNVSPALSPNGKYVIFLSEKDVFSTDLFLAEAANGKIIRKVASSRTDQHLEALNSIESAGTWSPNSKQFAFVGFNKGRNTIVIKEVASGKTISNIKIDHIPAFTNPAWSPDGKEIVFTGLVNGQTDLYSYNIKKKKTRQLTNDRFAEIQANFSADGKKLVYATDQASLGHSMSKAKWTFDIGVLDLETGSKEILDIFSGADNLNPNFDETGNILFLSDRDGYRNIYKYVTDSNKVYQFSDFKTGVSGITEYSPALSVARKTDRVLFSHYNDNSYNIHQFRQNKVEPKEVELNDVHFQAGTLPTIGKLPNDPINEALSARGDALETITLDTLFNRPYKPKFSLDYLGGGAGVGVGSSSFGSYTGLAGGLDMVFGDILGNNQIYSQLALNGEIYDIGGQVSYINRSKRIAWGAGISHIPYRFGWYGDFGQVQGAIGPNGLPVIYQETNLIRIFDEGVQVFAQYPFSKTLRVESGLSTNFRSFRQDLYTDFYETDGQYIYNIQGARERDKIPTTDVIQIDSYYALVKGWRGDASVGLVGDNSFFGVTSPLAGHRFRISLAQNIGTDQYTSIIGDFRKYFWFKPISLAIRGLSYLRFEQKANSLYPLYIGQMGFVRGYGSFFSNYLTELDKYDISFGQVIGSKALLASGEIRIPLSGPKRLSLIPSNYFLLDIALFYDIGTAFNEFSHFSGTGLKPAVLMSTGISGRINLFGALILEPYFAWPIQKDSKRVFGLNLIPGW